THGNYDQYYATRNLNTRIDPRLLLMDPSWFAGKRILDIGCNAGMVSLQLAMYYLPRHVQGIDIDPSLIRKANHDLAARLSLAQHLIHPATDPLDRDYDYFPQSCSLFHGPLKPIHTHGEADPSGSAPDPPILPFPANVSFRCGNWLTEPIPHASICPRFDVILALSITKWIHLNGGDTAIKHFFTKIYQSLNRGGRFILEPQPWHNYKIRKGLSPEILANYRSIQLLPDGFDEYLRTQVGFSAGHRIG
ncbi:Bicoid-interacting protein 3-domain-containing protein, partial [Polychytrium aggregatum]|uniref:Bicoid-interacting protein 3-domain-containing protein n=1 Tax=Polychytrium aggregatum TaxID=110093 RepID=UPI0022FDC072